MKSLFFSVLLLFGVYTLRIHAQELGTANYRCTYKLSYSNDPNQVAKKTEDFMILEMGPISSAFYSYHTFRVDSAIKSDLAHGVPAMEMLASHSKYGRKGVDYQIFKDKRLAKTITVDKLAIQNFKYEEPLHAMKWEILNENSNLLGYEVRKAVCSFSGRDYEAWYAPAIAFDNGPWKFGGLPGLILKINDSKNEFSFELTGFQSLNPVKTLEIPEKKITEINKLEFLKRQDRLNRKPYEYLRTQMGIQIKPLDDAAKANFDKVRPYNPMELN